MAEIPRYIATVDVDTDREDLGVQRIALTANPAIIIKGVAFAAEVPEAAQAKDEKKMRIAAPVLVPTKIYRKADGGHELVFTAEEIEGIMSQFMKRLNNQNPLFKLEHPDKGSSPAYILESWIVEDAETDKANTVFGLDVPVGSWMVVIQITEKDYYDEVVRLGATGLSIEGFLGHKLEELSNEKVMAEESEAVKVDLPDGEYTGADGKVFVVKGGKVAPAGTDAELEDEADKPEETEGEKVEMADEELEDGSMLSTDGELKVGAKTPAKDGTYKTKSGKVVVVAAGEVTEVKEKPAEEMEEDTPVSNSYSKEEVDQMFNDLREEFAGQIADLELQIEGKQKEGEKGEAVEMSAQEMQVGRITMLREGLAKLNLGA